MQQRPEEARLAHRAKKANSACKSTTVIETIFSIMP
jgi:hypothetical protein